MSGEAWVRRQGVACLGLYIKTRTVWEWYTVQTCIKAAEANCRTISSYMSYKKHKSSSSCSAPLYPRCFVATWVACTSASAGMPTWVERTRQAV